MKKQTVLTMMLLGGLIACNDPKGNVERDTLEEATQDSAVVYEDENGRVDADGVEIKNVGEDFWANINWDAPVANDPEMKSAGVEMRSTGEYNIYSLEDRVLFDTDKAVIKAEGEETLKSVAEEIKQLPASRQIRVYGYTDARAGEAYNQQLSEERARAVQKWLQEKGGIEGDRISIQAMGESNPRATNETAKGRQQNRRVAIVVANKE